MAKTDKKEPKLVLLLQELERREERTGDTVTIGRHPDCDVSLYNYPDCHTVSRCHAAFVFLNDRWFVRDLDSTNGTYVNGKRIVSQVPCLLEPGDSVSLAKKLTVLPLREQSAEPDPKYVEALQSAVNKIYPGLTMFVRDVDLPARVAGAYTPGMILRDAGFVDASNRVMGMVTSHRFAILSNHMTDLRQFEQGTNWGLHVANPNSRFKVLGSHTCGEKTAIFLLHLPNDDSWTLFRNTVIDMDKKVLADSIRRFEAKCNLEPVPELATEQWRERCRFPVGMDDSGKPFPVE